MNELTIKNELALLKADLKAGDEIVSEISPGGEEIRTSKKVGDARIKVINLVQSALISKEISPKQAGELTRLFGKLTSKMYWI